ncbi:MAG TPA: hypothetical protein DCY05_09770 [Spirochaetaceae bacterium]|nr:hypothetical protein [Spirochaetaceae bacterium]
MLALSRVNQASQEVLAHIAGGAGQRTAQIMRQYGHKQILGLVGFTQGQIGFTEQALLLGHGLLAAHSGQQKVAEQADWRGQNRSQQHQRIKWIEVADVIAGWKDQGAG